MIGPVEHLFERERIQCLMSYSILDTLPEEDYDNLTTIAAEICGTPISLVSLVDDKRQWFKSHYGLGATETPKQYAFCAHAINDASDVFIVPDARKDDRFYDNPLVLGNPYVIFYAGVPLKAKDGLPLGTLCVIAHEPRHLNEDQVRSLKALARQTMNLLELRKAKLELQESFDNMLLRNSELEKFAFEAAHDIKSPLNNISILADIALKEYGEKLDNDSLRIFEMIQFSSKKLKALVNDLLEYYRSENVLKEKHSTIDVHDLVAEVESLLVTDKSVCEVKLISNVREIVANKTAVQQILINLLVNAIKYNDKQVAVITIEVFENDSEYRLIVQDNGPGIPKVYHSKIFEIFSTLKANDRYGEVGSGVGLATVSKLVKALGGSIGIDPDEKNGAKFIFSIGKADMAQALNGKDSSFEGNVKEDRIFSNAEK